MSLIKKIKEYYKKGYNRKNTLFTTPSHGQGEMLPPLADKLLGRKFYKCDFSEIEGFDNLRQPEGVIKSVLEKFSTVYDSKRTFLLTNGSTSGMIAMMMSVLKEGDKVLIARNCHISVHNALVLTGAVPVWFMPEFDKEWGVYKGITKDSVAKELEVNKDIKAVVITSPTYEGLFGDIEGISAVCGKYGAKLIVDEAHGALLNFGDFKSKPAILCGADMSVQSLHKTAGAPNPCALLHVAKTSEINPDKVQDCLNIINTTSPSYPLMLACEICVDFLASENGRQEVKKLFDNINKFKNSLPQNVEVYDGYNDPTKILLKINGKSAYDFSKLLNENYFIEEEFSNEKSMLFITGIGTSAKKIKRLCSAVKKISAEKLSAAKECDFSYEIPPMSCSPKEALQKDFETVSSDTAVGRVSAEVLSDYPPGIPFITAGEIITENILQFVDKDILKVCK